MHDGFGGVRMFGEKFGLVLDLPGDFVKLCARGTRRLAMVLFAMAAQMIVKSSCCSVS